VNPISMSPLSDLGRGNRMGGILAACSSQKGVTGSYL
jgi:hypothetical protein